MCFYCATSSTYHHIIGFFSTNCTQCDMIKKLTCKKQFLVYMFPAPHHISRFCKEIDNFRCGLHSFNCNKGFVCVCGFFFICSIFSINWSDIWSFLSYYMLLLCLFAWHCGRVDWILQETLQIFAFRIAAEGLGVGKIVIATILAATHSTTQFIVTPVFEFLLVMLQ